MFRGDETLRVGARFLSDVRVALPPGTTRLRLRATSPEHTGVLIDDWRVHRSALMAVRSVSVVQKTHPVFVGLRDNALLEIRVETEGDLRPLRVRRISLETDGTTRLDDVRRLRAFFTGREDSFASAAPFGDEARAAEAVAFTGDQVLERGRNHFWISVELDRNAALDRFVDAGLVSVDLAGPGGATETVTPLVRSPPGARRIGAAVRRAGADGVHTYRIPGLATTKAGTLLAVYDARHRSSRDLPGDIDVGLSRSTDGGRTWEPMRIVLDLGDDPDFRYDGVGDPSILVDETTGRAWVAATWSHGDRSWNGSGPGLDPDETGQLLLAFSDDDGRSWSAPINVTRQVKDPAWRFVLAAPGRGLTMRDGTLVFPAQFRDANGLPHSTMMSSRDGGQTWSIGTGARPDTTECQAVVLDDGSRWIGQWSSAPTSPRRSTGAPTTLSTRPSVLVPTGTLIGWPVSTASAPRTRPSVGSIETVRTRFSPRCCSTSQVRFDPSSEPGFWMWMAL